MSPPHLDGEMIDMTYDDIKQQLIWAGRVLVAEGQDDFTRGHISFRLPDNPSRFFMKPHSLGSTRSRWKTSSPSISTATWSQALHAATARSTSTRKSSS